MPPEARHRVKSRWRSLSVLARVIEGSAFALSLLLLVPLLGGPGSKLISSIGANAITTRPSSSTYYELVSRQTGKVLDVSDASQANGGRVIQWPTHSGSNQQFQFVPMTDGGFEIVARHSGKVLDVAHDSNANGAKIVQADDIHGIYQEWSVGMAGDDYVTLTNYASGKMLSIVPASSAGGARIGQWEVIGTPAVSQQWQLIKIDPVPAAKRHLSPAGAPRPGTDTLVPAPTSPAAVIPATVTPSPVNSPAMASPTQAPDPNGSPSPGPAQAGAPASSPPAAVSPTTVTSPTTSPSPSDASGQVQKQAQKHAHRGGSAKPSPT